MNDYRLKVTFEGGKKIAQNVKAYDSIEAIAVFLTRPHMRATIENSMNEIVDEIVKVEFIA